MTSPAPAQHQSTKAAARREADRVRKRDARAKAKAEGVPHSSLVDYAISQATSFCINHADRRVWRPDDAWTPINASVLYAIALDVLVVRFGRNAEKSAAALKAKLGRQEAHGITGMVPSTDPAPGHPRYRLTAPEDLSTAKLPAPPLPPQDLSAGR